MAEKKVAVQRVVVTRHHLGYRLLHWGFVLTGVILLISGLQINGIYGNLPLFPAVRATHILVGEVWACLSFSFLYYLLATGDYNWYGLRRIPMALGFFIKEAKAWLGVGPHVEEPILYDVKKKDYAEKIVPTEVFVWWIYFLIGILFLVTGLAMAFPNYTGFVYTIADGLAPLLGGVGGYTLIRTVHRFDMYLLVTVAIMHIYAAYLFHMLRSMVFGDRAEPAKK